MTRFAGFFILALTVLCASFSPSAAWAGGDDKFSEPISLGMRGDDDVENEYPPGDPLPEESTIPADETVFMITPAPQFSIRGGYAGYGKPYTNGAGVGVMVFLDSGRMGALLEAGAAGGQDGVFSHAEVDLKVRMRKPLERTRRFWWGVGVDAGGRYAHTDRLDDNFRLHAVGLVGTMFATKRSKVDPVTGALRKEVHCVVHVFGKVTLGVHDNRGNIDDRWAAPWNPSFDQYGRPGVGAEGMAQCGTLRVLGNYQHTFTFGSGGATDHLQLQVSKTWPVKGHWEVGVFGKGQLDYERDRSGLEPMDPYYGDRAIPGVFGGIEVRY